MAVERLTFEMNAVGNAVPEMRRVQTQLQQMDRTMQRSTRTMARQVGGMRRFTRGMGGLGLQVQDVAVQASMGTDALRIFSMQGPQILSLLGPIGMIAGAVAGVGAAVLMANGSVEGLSFDFARFASDMAPALEPLRGLVGMVGDAFRYVGRIALTALNGILNGINRAAVVISHLPAIAREAFDRVIMRINLVKTNFLIMTNQITYFFQNAMYNMVASASAAANAIAAEINSVLGTTMATNVGTTMLNSLGEGLLDLGDEYAALTDEAYQLSDALSQPNQALADMRQNLADIESIDIASYFSRAANAASGDGGGGGSLADALTEAQQRTQDLANSMQRTLENGFMSIIDGSKSVKDAFKDMARAVIAELYRVLVVQRIVGSFNAQTGTGTGIVGFFGRLFGGFRAQGGAVAANRSYIVGENGPEMMVPGTSGRVIPTNQLGGAGGETVIVQQTINISTGVQQTVRAEIRQLMPQIAENAKQAVVDAKRRGGSYGRAFA